MTQPQQNITEKELWAVLSDGDAEAATVSDRPSTTIQDAQPTASLVSSGDLEEEEFDYDFADEVTEQRTITTFASSPMVRLALVSTAVLTVMVLVGSLIGGFRGSVQDAAKKPTTDTKPTASTVPIATNNSPNGGDLKAQMAFQTQQQALNAQNTPSPSVSTSPPPTVKTPPPAPPAPIPAPPPAPVAIAPPSTIPDPPPALPPIAVSPLPPVNITPIDPNKEWQDLAQSATYGSLPIMVMNTPPPAPVPVVAIAAQPPKAPHPQSDMGGLPSLASYSPSSRRQIRIGTQVRARLINPIAWSGDGKEVAFSGASTPKFIAKLEQPLVDTDGNEIVPEGAELVVAVRSLEPNSGMAELTALQIIIGNQEFAPPLGAFTLRGANGNPLIADKFQDKGKDIAAADRAMFFFGALSKVGELMNRTDSQVTITANGSSSSSTTNGKPNLIGGVLQGGFSALAQQQQQRNQQWYQEILRRPDIRYIPAGKELSLYVNQTVTL